MAELIAQYQVGTFASPSNGDALDATVVKGNDNTLKSAHNSHEGDGGVHLQSSTLALRPTAGSLGRKWYTTDGKRVYYDNSTTWDEIAYLPLVGGTVTGAATFSVSVTVGGANPAAIGQIRLPNDNVISWRNAANTADLTLRLNSSDNFRLDSNLVSTGGFSSSNLTPVSGWYLAANTKGLLVQNSVGGNKVAVSLDAANVWQFGDGLPANFNAGITGNLTGNLTGTVLTAAQGNITSLGTLTSLSIGAGGITSSGGIVLNSGGLVLVNPLNAIVIPATARFYLDGGSDTYLYEVSANAVQLITGGTLSAGFTSTSFTIPATNRFYLDGGGDTYLYEDVANRISIVTAGAASLGVSQSGTFIPATAKLWLDGGGDTYIYESSANIVTVITGGAARLTVDTTTTTVAGSLVVTGTDFAIEKATNGTDIRIQTYGSKILHLNQLGNTVQAYNLTITNGLTVTGGGAVITGGITGSLTGNVTGNVTGTLTAGIAKYYAGVATNSVSTTFTTVYTATGSSHFFVIVCGDDGTNTFQDLVCTFSTVAPVTHSSKTIRGTPDARNYQWSGSNLQMRMSVSQTSNIKVAPIEIG